MILISPCLYFAEMNEFGKHSAELRIKAAKSIDHGDELLPVQKKWLMQKTWWFIDFSLWPAQNGCERWQRNNSLQKGQRFCYVYVRSKVQAIACRKLRRKFLYVDYATRLWTTIVTKSNTSWSFLGETYERPSKQNSTKWIMKSWQWPGSPRKKCLRSYEESLESPSPRKEKSELTSTGCQLSHVSVPSTKSQCG